MSFWCSVYLYVPIERLAVALRATAGFALPSAKGPLWSGSLPTMPFHCRCWGTTRWRP